MNIRNITKEDLPKLAELLSCEELTTRNDISFEHSVIAIDDNSMIVAFVILRQRSLQDFFEGKIPNENITEDDEDYMEGDKIVYREEMEEHFPENIQYELLYSYESKNDKTGFFANECFGFLIKDFIFIWRENNNKNISKTFIDWLDRDFNSVISDYTPTYD